METLTANLSGGVRRERLWGREHLVAPLTLIVPGVMNGSNGPLYYPPEEVGKDPSIWNHVPIVAYHPYVNGLPVSARSSDILDQQGIGLILHSRFEGKLVAEAWFDVDQTKRVDNRVLENLEAGKPIEVSTGLFLDKDPAPEGATFNGKSYSFITKNYRPDHLAILPDKVGACSVEDGCGVLVNESTKKTLWDRFLSSLGLTDNEISHEDTRSALAKQMRKRFGDNPELDIFVVEVFDDSFVFHKDGKLMRLGYTKDGNKIEISDEFPEEVQRVTDYEPVDNQKTPDKEEDVATLNDTERKGLVDFLIGNCDCWKEDDRKILNEFTDDKLKSLKSGTEKAKQAEAVANAAKEGFQDQQGNSHVFNSETGKWEIKEKENEPEPAPTTNSKTEQPGKPMTADEWMKQAPPEIQSVVRNAMETEKRDKDKLVQKLTANVSEDNKERVTNRLKEKSLDELRDLEALIPAPSQDANTRTPNYSGSAAPPVANRDELDQDDLLTVPTINWAEEAAAK